MTKGDHIVVRVGDQTVDAVVVMVSDNEDSLLVNCDEAVRLGSLVAFGFLPILRGDDRQYRELITGTPVTVEAHA